MRAGILLSTCTSLVVGLSVVTNKNHLVDQQHIQRCFALTLQRIYLLALREPPVLIIYMFGLVMCRGKASKEGCRSRFHYAVGIIFIINNNLLLILK
jgi:hypothetical protein